MSTSDEYVGTDLDLAAVACTGLTVYPANAFGGCIEKILIFTSAVALCDRRPHVTMYRLFDTSGENNQCVPDGTTELCRRCLSQNKKDIYH